MKPLKFSIVSLDAHKTRLINQIYKILPLYEEGGTEWRKLRDSIYVEMFGYNEIFKNENEYFVCMGRLIGLDSCKDNKEQFRKTIFSCISNIQEVFKDA